MAGDLGLSFAPLPNQGQAGSNPAAANASSPAPVQDAIKMLSLRIPRMAGAAPGLAPNALLGGAGASGLAMPTLPGPGMAAQPGNAPNLEELLRRLLGLGAAPQTAGPSAGPSTAPPSGGSFAPLPMPNITPGVLPGDQIPNLPAPTLPANNQSNIAPNVANAANTFPTASAPWGTASVPSAPPAYDPFADQFEPNGYYGNQR